MSINLTPQTLNLELNSNKNYKMLNAHQGDNIARVVNIFLTSNNEIFDLSKLSSTTVAHFSCGVGKNLKVINHSLDINRSENYIKLTLTKEMLDEDGILDCELTLKDGNEIITTQTFNILVAKSVLANGSDIVKSEVVKKMELALQLAKEIGNLESVADIYNLINTKVSTNDFNAEIAKIEESKADKSSVLIDGNIPITERELGFYYYITTDSTTKISTVQKKSTQLWALECYSEDCQKGDVYEVYCELPSTGMFTPPVITSDNAGVLVKYYGREETKTGGSYSGRIEITQDNAKKIYFTASEGTLRVEKILNTQVKDKVLELDTLINTQISAEIDELNSKSTLLDTNKADKESVLVDEYTHITDVVNGTYYYYGSGKINTKDSSPSMESYAENCQVGDKYRVSGTFKSVSGDINLIAVSDENRNHIFRNYTAVKGETVTFDNIEYEVTNNNAKIIYFSASAGTLKVEKLTKTELKDKVLEINETVSDNTDRIQALETSISNPLYGKTVLIEGDSIAEGQGAGGTSYGDIIAEKYGMNMTKKAVGGSTIWYRESDTNPKSIYQRVTSLNPQTEKFDYMVIDGGINDAFNVPSKNYNFGEFNTFDVSTTIGATEALCRWLNINYPDTKKLFVLTHHKTRTWDKNGAMVDFDERQETLWNLLMQVFKKWGMPFINLREETCLASWGTVTDTLEEVGDFGWNYADKYFKLSTNIYGGHGDGTHPNREAYEKFYVPLIESKLKTL